MSALEINRNFEKIFSRKQIIKMNTKIVRELRSIVKDKAIISIRRLT